MSELKPCPFCGKMPEVYEFNRRKYYGCGRDECYTAGFNGTVTKSIWNTRPIEDDLRNRIAELEAELGKDVDLTIVGLRKELLNAQSRIAELEAEIDQLTAHDATERQDDKLPNDTQTQTIVYGKESER